MVQVLAKLQVLAMVVTPMCFKNQDFVSIQLLFKPRYGNLVTFGYFPPSKSNFSVNEDRCWKMHRTNEQKSPED